MCVLINYGRFIAYVGNTTNLTKVEFANIQDNQLMFVEEENGATIYGGIYSSTNDMKNPVK